MIRGDRALAHRAVGTATAILAVGLVPWWATPAGLSGQPTSGAVADARSALSLRPDPDEDLVASVGEDLVSATARVVGQRLEARFRIVTECSGSVVNACVYPRQRPVTIRVTRGLLEQIDRDPHLLAFILGHELGHVVVGHRSGPTPLVSAGLNRAHESAADSVGMLLAVGANYSHRKAVRGILRLARSGPFQRLASSHPSWSDRAAFLNTFRGDDAQSQLWRSMGSFLDGVHFLRIEQYPLAERAFEAVTEEFPGSYEGWANLGYARLMQYLDGLREEDIQRFGIGQLVMGAFHRRAGTLEARVRGIDADLWSSAVDALHEARRLAEEADASTTLIRCNLGVAFLVHPSGEKRVDRATDHLETAARRAGEDSTLHPAARAAVVLNAGVAQALAGRLDEARQAFRRARTLAGDRSRSAVSHALVFNQAYLMDPSREEASRLAPALEDYLSSVSPSSSWWEIAYGSYVGLANRVGLTPKSRGELRGKATAGAGFRPVLRVASGDFDVALGEPIDDVASRLGPHRRDTVVAGTDIVRLHYPDRGLSVLGTEAVLAMVMESDATPVNLRAKGPGGDTAELRVGMPAEDLRERLGAYVYETNYDYRSVADPDRRYRYYPELGLGFDLSRGSVGEIVVARIPAGRL